MTVCFLSKTHSAVLTHWQLATYSVNSRATWKGYWSASCWSRTATRTCCNWWQTAGLRPENPRGDARPRRRDAEFPCRSTRSGLLCKSRAGCLALPFLQSAGQSSWGPCAVHLDSPRSYFPICLPAPTIRFNVIIQGVSATLGQTSRRGTLRPNMKTVYTFADF